MDNAGKKRTKKDIQDTALMPMPTFEDIKQSTKNTVGQMGTMADEAKRKVLQALQGKSMQQMAPSGLAPKEIEQMRMLGGMAMEKGKAESKMNDMNRLQQEAGTLEDLAAFGDKDAEIELAAKKEALKKYLNNR